MKFITRLVAVVAMLACFAFQARTQTSSATISGHLMDQSKGVVANAEATLTNEETNVTVTTRANGSGDFVFPDVQPGTFSVLIQAPGYKETKKVHLVLL